jgi:selenocysteine lyase/cysteine desulfurase
MEGVSSADAVDVCRNPSRRTYVPHSSYAAALDFSARFPDFDPDGHLATLRQRDYGRLDVTDQVYLDYTGGGLYAASQIDAHAELLRGVVLGNPHSNNPTSLEATTLVERCREQVCEFFHASPEEYRCVFTANATGALKLVGESYPFAPGGTFALTYDNHNSVNGIREFARRSHASVAYVPVMAPELRLDRTAMSNVLAGADPSKPNLLAFPAQSNFSGVQHPLDLVDEAHRAGWDVLIDATAFAPTNRLDVDKVQPDFVAISFYEIIGHPTGVGCLLVRHDRLERLTRPWFSGGTVTFASVQGDGHYLHPGAAGFEDGTVDYLNIPAVAFGLRHLDGVGLDAIHARVMCLAQWLLEALTGLRHRNGSRMVEILGPTDTVDRGGTVTFLMKDRHGRVVDDRRVEELANRAHISLRTGCFCNPGAGEIAHRLRADQMTKWFGRDEPMSVAELREGLFREHDRAVAAIRITLALGAVAFVYANFDKLFWPIRAVSAFFFVDFFIRVAAGLERSPAGVAARRLTHRQTPQWVSAKPKRFAWSLGAAMALAMTIITNSGIHGPLPRTICLICLVLMWLEAVLGLCLGCEIYRLLVRRGWRAQDPAFEICPNGVCDLGSDGAG